MESLYLSLFNKVFMNQILALQDTKDTKDTRDKVTTAYCYSLLLQQGYRKIIYSKDRFIRGFFPKDQDQNNNRLPVLVRL